MRKKKNTKVIPLLLAATLVFSSSATSVHAESNDTLVKWNTLFGLNGAEKSVLYDSVNDAIVSTTDTANIVTAGVLDGKNLTGEGLKGDRDAAISCYDKSGNLLWQTLAGGTKQDYFYGLTEGAYGGLVAVGASKSDDGDFKVKNPDNYDAVIAKFDNQGKIVKTDSFGGSDKEEFNSVASTFDGGYIAAGYSRSTDGDLEGVVSETRSREAILVKYDKDLNRQWVVTSGAELESTSGVTNEFEDVIVDSVGNIIATGVTTLTTGDMEGTGSGKKDAFVTKYTETGEKVWTKTYGGSQDDLLTEIKTAHDKNPALGTGFIISGTTKSTDGIFKDYKTTEDESAFILKIDDDGEEEWLNVLESSSKVTGNSVLPTMDGYLLTGSFTTNDMDFTGMTVYGKEDIFVANYSNSGDFRSMHSVGGNDKDTVEGIYPGHAEDYLLFGSTRSSDQMFEKRQGPVDGFIMSLDKEIIDTYSTEKYLVPIVAWKADEDVPSMMAPLLYKEAFVEKTGELYTVTAYFVNAKLMGAQVNASTLGAVSYEYNGEMIPALYDEYDATTQVKTVKVTTKEMTKPIPVHIEDTMGDIRFSLDMSKAVESDIPPYFPDVEVAQPDFKNAYKLNIGGSSEEYTNDMVVLKNGNIAVAGQTYSQDGDFKAHLGGLSNGFVNIYSPEGKLVDVKMIGTTDPSMKTYNNNIIACEDGGYIVGGGYISAEENAYTKPSGDLESLLTETSVHGGYDAFLARYNEKNELVWINGFSGSGHDQIKTIINDQDGFLALYETNSMDGDMQDQHRGLFDLAIVKYSYDGEKQWQRVLGGNNIESARAGLAVLSDGNYIVTGINSSGSGDFEGIGYYGDTFDIFAMKLNREGEIIWRNLYGGNKNDYCYKVLATSDGGFMLGGYTKSTTETFEGTGTSYDNAFVAKLDADGKVEWNDVIKSSDKSEVTDILEFDDKYVVLGETRGNDFDFKDMNKGSKDVFISSYDKDGNRTYLETIGGSVEDTASKIVKLNSYQNAILFYGDSNDGDLKGLNRGGDDGTLIVYNYKEKPETKPDQPVVPEEKPETKPDQPEVPEEKPETKPDQPEVPEEKPETVPDKEDTPKTGDLFHPEFAGSVLIISAFGIAVIYYTKRKKENK